MKHFSTIHFHYSIWIHKTYGWEAPSLKFVNYLADYQWTSIGQTTNGGSLFITNDRKLIMTALVLQVWFWCLDVKTFWQDVANYFVSMGKKTYGNGKNRRKLHITRFKTLNMGLFANINKTKIMFQKLNLRLSIFTV